MKLRLDVESLEVETFAAEPEALPQKGTVHAHSGRESVCACPFSVPWTNCTGCTCDAGACTY